MIHRVLATLFVLVIPMLFAPTPAAGQGKTAAGEAWSPPQTPWGHPDLQGAWTNTTTTPMERPADLAGKAFLTEEEWAERNPGSGVSTAQPSASMPTGAYNDFWLEKGELSMRTALIVEPSDGRLPPATETEQQRLRHQTGSTGSYGSLPFSSWLDFNVYDRCITRGMPSAMMSGFHSGFYNHNYQILQTPDNVAIIVEMIHDARIIPLDGRSHLSPTVRQWMGDSRGHWEGDTLVVETTNFTNKIRQRTGIVIGGDEHLSVVERLTRIDADTIDYRVAVTDPTVWTGPWTAAVPMTALGGSLYEYACHEGNYALPNMLAGARAEEAR